MQSVGMAMTVQRERERLTFQETEYWSVKGNFSAVDTANKGVDGSRILRVIICDQYIDRHFCCTRNKYGLEEE